MLQGSLPGKALGELPHSSHARKGPNILRFTGVAPDATLLSYKVFSNAVSPNTNLKSSNAIV